LGELYSGVDNAKAIAHFEDALKLAKSSADKTLISAKINEYRQKKTKADPANYTK